MCLSTAQIFPSQLLHVSDPPNVDEAPLPMKPASYAAAADSPPAHLARVEYMYLRVGGKQKQLVRPKCQPIQGAGQGGRIQIGQKAKIVSVDDLKHHTAPMDPAEATCLGRPPQTASHLYSPACNFMKIQTGGRGHVEEQFVFIIFVRNINDSQIWHQ